MHLFRVIVECVLREHLTVFEKSCQNLLCHFFIESGKEQTIG